MAKLSAATARKKVVNPISPTHGAIIGRASQLARQEDEDVSAAIRVVLEGEGINVRLNATCIGFSRRGADIVAHVDCAAGDPEVCGSHVLLAMGLTSTEARSSLRFSLSRLTTESDIDRALEIIPAAVARLRHLR